MNSWRLKGRVVLSCNCDVFCPCMPSLGKSRPTHGVCHTWWALDIEQGHAGDVKLAGHKAVVLMDIPGPLAEGGWVVGLYLEESMSEPAADVLTEILSGQAGGSIGWFSLMIADFLGSKRVPISFESRGRGWQVSIPKVLDAEVDPVVGPDGEPTRIVNSGYWMAPDVTLCTGTRSRFRDWGRNWNLSGGSAEYADVDWEGP